MKKILTTVLFLATIGLLSSCQQSARGPEKTEDEGGGAGATAATKNPEKDPSLGPQTSPGSSEPAVVTAPELSAECQGVHDQFQKLREGIPYVFSDLKRKPDEIDADLQRSIQLGEKFLADCGENAYSPGVKILLARHLSSRYKRQEALYKTSLTKQTGLKKLNRTQRAQIAAEVKALMTSYLDRIEELGQAGLAASKPGTRAHCEGLSVLADLSFNYLRDNKSHRTLAGQYIAAGCEDVLKGNQDYYYNICMSYLRDSQFEEARQYILKVLKDRSDRPQYAIYNICLFEALYALGEMEQLEELMVHIQKEYVERLKDSTLPKSIWAQYSQWSMISDFWVGFATYALGDLDSARAGFQGYIDKADQLEQQLGQAGKELPSVVRIYRDFRARDYSKYIQDFHGKLPAVEFDAGVEWLTGRPVSFAKTREEGKVLAIIFRQAKNLRALPFLKLLDSLQKQNPDKFVAATLSFMPRGLTAEARQQRLDNLRQELQDNELKLSSGFDVSDKHQVFRGLHATVGSASFLIFDSEGKAAWYHVDPTARDLNTLQRVADRLLQ